MKTTTKIYGIALALTCSLVANLKGQNIYVANTGSGTIGEYGLDGSTVNASLITGLNEPVGIAISGNDLFVANAGSGTIGEYTTCGGTVNASLISGLNKPTGIAISGNDIFVANADSGTIGEYTTSGATVNASLISGLNNPFLIAISGNNLFVANQVLVGDGSVGEYTTSGATVNASLITGLDAPVGVAISGNDLFVGNFRSGLGLIGEYTTSGATVNASLISVGTEGPTGLAIWGNDLFVVNAGPPGTIGEYTTSGATVNASLITGLHYAGGIAIGNTNACTNGCINIYSPNDLTVDTCSNCAIVNFCVPVSDLCCTGTVTTTCNPPSGSCFPVGVNPVEITAVDSCGNTNYCSFNIIVVQDTNPPVITACPTNINICTNADGCGTMPDATSLVQGVTGNGGSAVVTQNIPPGTVICNNTNVTFTLADNCGDVTQTNVPCTLGNLQIQCWTNVVVLSCTNVQVYYDPTAIDACCSNWGVICSPSSGSSFEPDTTNIVTCVATDMCGNISSCTFTVAVIQNNNPPVILSCPTNILILVTNADGCGTMPDDTSLVQATGSAGVTQSIPPGTMVCSNTTVTFTVTNACGYDTCVAPVYLYTEEAITFTNGNGGGTPLVLSWVTNGPNSWQLQYSTDLYNWTLYNVASNLVVLPPVIITPAMNQEFFRLVSTN